MANATYSTTQDVIVKLQQLKSKTKLNFFKNISSYYDEMNIRTRNGDFQLEEDLFTKNGPSVVKIFVEVLLLMKFLRTKPQVRNMNCN